MKLSRSRRVVARVTCASPWPCIDDFQAIVTHPGIVDPPTPARRRPTRRRALRQRCYIGMTSVVFSHVALGFHGAKIPLGLFFHTHACNPQSWNTSFC